MRMAVRNINNGLWDFHDLADALPANPPVPRRADFVRLDSALHPAASDVIRSFVRISCTIPVKLDGFPRARKIGFGVVVDAEKGLVIVSRAIVPYDLCDIAVTVADSVIVDAKVLFMHPLANYAIIQYDPSLVQAPVMTAKLSTENIKQGDCTTFLGFNQNLRVVVAKTTVTDITAVAIPSNGSAPRYRAINLDAITVDTGLSSQCGNGVLVAEDGTIQALWLSYLGERSPHSNKDIEYHLGLATPSLLPIINQIRSGTIPNLRILNVETNTVQMSQVRIMGVSEDWIQRVAQANPSRHQLFMVRKVDCAPPSAPVFDPSRSLMEGDVILTLNDQLITQVSELDIMYNATSLRALIVRNGREMTVEVPTIPTTDLSTSHALLFCGAVIHRPHHAVRQQISKLHSEVYVSARMRGSPSYQYGLAPTEFITAVNSIPTPTLEAFLDVVRTIPDNTYFRLRVVTFDNVPLVVTMKKNEHYFPTVEVFRDPTAAGGWRRRTVGEESEGEGEASLGDGGIVDEAMGETGLSDDAD